MVFIRSPLVALMTLGLQLANVQGFQIYFSNMCDDTVDLYDTKSIEQMAPGGTVTRTIDPNSGAHVFRKGTGAQATLAEFSGDGGFAWFDISIIPTGPLSGPDYCMSLDACKAYTGGVGFNVAMQIAPHTPSGDRCVTLTCMADGCADAYQYPTDDTKTHACPINTDFDVIFCPGGTGGATPAPTTEAPTPEPTTEAPTPEPTTEAPTPEPTTETPSPSPETQSVSGSGNNEVAGEFDDALFSSSNSTSSDVGEDDTGTDSYDGNAPVSDNKYDTASTTTTTTTDDTPATSEASGSDKAEEVSTQAEASSSGTATYVVVCLGCVAGLFGAVAVYVIRKKKAELDAIDDKTPYPRTTAVGGTNGAMMMRTPSGSCVL